MGPWPLKSQLCSSLDSLMQDNNNNYFLSTLDTYLWNTILFPVFQFLSPCMRLYEILSILLKTYADLGK